MKNVIEDFNKVSTDNRFRFMGNVKLSSVKTIGSNRTLCLNELTRHFDAVVLAYGCQEDRKMNIPGEDLEGVVSGRAFVNWYFFSFSFFFVCLS